MKLFFNLLDKFKRLIKDKGYAMIMRYKYPKNPYLNIVNPYKRVKFQNNTELFCKFCEKIGHVMESCLNLPANAHLRPFYWKPRLQGYRKNLKIFELNAKAFIIIMPI